MDFAFSEREEQFRKFIAEFALKEIEPLISSMEERGFLRELVPKLARVGMLSFFVPEEYGGNGLGHVAKTIAMEEIAKVYPSIGLFLDGHYVSSYLISVFGSNEQKERYLPALADGRNVGALAVTEPSGGSDVTGIKTTARKRGEDYVISGRKCFITNSHLADVFLLLCKVGDSQDFAVFIVERDNQGLSLGRIEKKVGMRGAITGEIILDNCVVPHENLLGNIGDGLKLVLKAINCVGRPGIAAVAVGICYAALSEASYFAKNRVLYGKPISHLQAIQFLLADIYTQAESARLLTYRAASLLDKGFSADMEATLAKYVACEAAVKCTKWAAEVCGSSSVVKGSKVERLLRDAWVTIPSSGTSQIAKIVLGKQVLKS